MKRTGIFGVVCLAAVALGTTTGCDRMRSVAGFDKQAPDEFAVVTRAPLSMPPDYGLRPPTPGAERPQEAAVRDEAREILLRNSSLRQEDAVRSAVSSGHFSTGEASFLARAGALNVDPAIRQTVNRESTAIAEASKTLLDRVIFWQKPEEPGILVDPEKEAQRLREARAMGDAVNTGDVPIIERRQRGLLQGIF
jgi:hypothetical protein